MAATSVGSRNPLTRVPRAFGLPGAGSALVRIGAGWIGAAKVGVGFYSYLFPTTELVLARNGSESVIRDCGWASW